MMATSSIFSQSSISRQDEDRQPTTADNEDVTFERAVATIVERIEQDMRAYGDADANPLDLKNVEFQIQSDRILKVLDKTIENIEIALCLPYIAEQCKRNITDRKGLSADEVALLEICTKLISDDVQQDEESLVRLLIEHMDKTQGIYGNVVPYFIQKATQPNAQQLLQSLRDLRCLAEQRIAMTAPKEMAKEKVLHKMWTDNEKTREQVKELQAKYNVSESKLQRLVDEKTERLKVLQISAEQLNEENRVNIGREIYISNLKMNKASVDSKYRQKELETEMEKLTLEGEDVLQNNMKADKKLREEKTKVTQKLQSWLTKYDNDVGERSQQLFQLNDELDVGMRTLADWQRQLDTQEVGYNVLMAEKEAEEDRILAKNLLIFTTNRAAKLIQRSWRKMMKARKKKKKGTGKKRNRKS